MESRWGGRVQAEDLTSMGPGRAGLGASGEED